MNRILPTLLSGALAAAALLPAQTGPLVGFASDGAANSALLRQRLCEPPNETCTNALPAPSLAWAGGAALDTFRNVLWHTEGTRIYGVQLAGCDRDCVVPIASALGGRSVAGGLTFDAETQRLYHVESIPGMGGIVGYDLFPSLGCPQAARRCTFTLPTTRHTSGAIALDKGRDLFFVATSVFGIPGGAQNRILIVRRDDPNCGTPCLIPVPDCGRLPLEAITAMTYDACDDRIYISDGRRTLVCVVRINPTSGCPTLIAESCCAATDSQNRTWHGFDKQTIEPRQLGGGCLPARTCPSCPVPPRLNPIGLPQVGNPNFGFRIEEGPVGSTGFVLVNFGGCQSFQFGCGILYTGLPAAIALGPMPIAGGGPCSGMADFQLPIPENFALCNLLLCVQGAMVCPAGGIGLTNAQVVPLGS